MSGLVSVVFVYTYFLKKAAPGGFFWGGRLSEPLTHLKPVTRGKSRGLLSKGVLLLQDNTHAQSAADTPGYNPEYHMLGPLKEDLKAAWRKISQ